LRSLYSGFWATCARNCVFNSFYFASIFYVKENVLTPPKDMAGQVQQSLLTGLVGGNVATAFKMPFDIVKSRMQSQARGLPTSPHHCLVPRLLYSHRATTVSATVPAAKRNNSVRGFESLEPRCRTRSPVS
jgi:hypothetical protein